MFSFEIFFSYFLMGLSAPSAPWLIRLWYVSNSITGVCYIL